MSEIRVDHIEAQEIVVKQPDGKSSIALSAMKDGVGLWLRNGEKCIAIYELNYEFAIGFYNDTARPDLKAMDFAISADQNGNPTMQVVNDKNEVLFIDLAKLAEVVKQAEPKKVA